MENKTYTVTIKREDIIDTDSLLENSFEWGDHLWCDETLEYYKETFEKFIPDRYKPLLENKTIKEQFRRDVLQSVSFAYVNDLENSLLKLVDEFIKEQIEKCIDESYTLTWDNSPILSFSDNITLTFTQAEYIKHQKNRDYDDRIRYTFHEDIEELIAYYKSSFYYENINCSWNWDNDAKLKVLFDDCNETIYTIEKLLNKKYNLIKKNIKGKIPLIYRQKKIDNLING